MKNGIAAILISLLAAVVFVLHTWFPRLLPIDGVGAGLLVLVALPWLRGIIKSVEIPGVGKMELQEATATALLAQGTAESAQRQIDAFLPSGAVDGNKPSRGVGSTGQELAAEYNRIRASDAPSEQRTKKMDELFNRMVQATAVAKPEQMVGWLESNDRGFRLLGYAASYGSPDRAPVRSLVESVAVREDTPFGWYWGLVALRRAIQAQGPDTLEGSDQSKLVSLREKLPLGSDRRAELDKALALTLSERSTPRSHVATPSGQ